MNNMEHFFASPDIYASSRLIEYEDLRWMLHPFANGNLLLISTGKLRYLLLDILGFNPKIMNSLPHDLISTRPIVDAKMDPVLDPRKRKIVCDRLVHYEPTPFSIFGHQHQSGRKRISRRTNIFVDSINQNFTVDARQYIESPQRHF